MSTLFKLSQTNFNAALPEYQSNLYMLFCQDKKLRQEVCYPCGCLVCLASCVCLSPPPPPAARWVFLPPSSSLLLPRASESDFSPTNPTGMLLTQLSRIDYSAASLPPSPAPLMRAGRPGSGRRERERRQRDEGGRGKEAHQFIRPTAPPFHFAQEPTSRRRRGGKGSIPPEIIPLLRERTLSEGICLTNQWRNPTPSSICDYIKLECMHLTAPRDTAKIRILQAIKASSLCIAPGLVSRPPQLHRPSQPLFRDAWRSRPARPSVRRASVGDCVSSSSLRAANTEEGGGGGGGGGGRFS